MDSNIYSQMLRFFFLLSVTFAEDMKRAALSQVSEAKSAQYQKDQSALALAATTDLRYNTCRLPPIRIAAFFQHVISTAHLS